MKIGMQRCCTAIYQGLMLGTAVFLPSALAAEPTPLLLAETEQGQSDVSLYLSTDFRIKGAWHIQDANAYHSCVKTWVRKFNGVATRYLANYQVWFRTIDRESALGLKFTQWLALAMGSYV